MGKGLRMDLTIEQARLIHDVASTLGPAAASEQDRRAWAGLVRETKKRIAWFEDSDALPRSIVVVPAPGDRCGGSGVLPNDQKCPGCRACA